MIFTQKCQKEWKKNNKKSNSKDKEPIDLTLKNLKNKKKYKKSKSKDKEEDDYKVKNAKI